VRCRPHLVTSTPNRSAGRGFRDSRRARPECGNGPRQAPTELQAITANQLLRPRCGKMWDGKCPYRGLFYPISSKTCSQASVPGDRKAEECATPLSPPCGTAATGRTAGHDCGSWPGAGHGASALRDVTCSQVVTLRQPDIRRVLLRKWTDGTTGASAQMVNAVPQVIRCPISGRERIPLRVRGIVTGKAGKTVHKGGVRMTPMGHAEESCHDVT